MRGADKIQGILCHGWDMNITVIKMIIDKILRQSNAGDLLKELYACYNEHVNPYKSVGRAICVAVSKKYYKQSLLGNAVAMDDAIVAGMMEAYALGLWEEFDWLSEESINSTITPLMKVSAFAERNMYSEMLEYINLIRPQAEMVLRNTSYLTEIPFMEIFKFYEGNANYVLGNYQLAAKCYSECLAIRQGMLEAQNNFRGVALKLLGNDNVNTMIVHPFISDLKIKFTDDMVEIKNIPIFINSRDRVGCLKKLINALLERGYINIYILDNASTYGPLLRYYNCIEAIPGITVIYLRDNYGYRALYEAKILNKMSVDTPYVYTDSDVVPLDECPYDFIKDMLKVLEYNPFIRKVGLSLKIDDVPKNDICQGNIDKEKKYWQVSACCGGYNAPVDTTFALYRNTRSHFIRAAVRMAYPFQARHIPWYYDESNIPDDELYYIEHADASSTIAECWKN